MTISRLQTLDLISKKVKTNGVSLDTGLHQFELNSDGDLTIISMDSENSPRSCMAVISGLSVAQLEEVLKVLKREAA